MKTVLAMLGAALVFTLGTACDNLSAPGAPDAATGEDATDDATADDSTEDGARRTMTRRRTTTRRLTTT